MKKSYAVLALAAAMATTAMAAPVSNVKSEIKPAVKQTSVEMLEQGQPVKVTDGMYKAPATADVNQFYGFNYYGRTSSDNSLQSKSIRMQKISDTEVMVYGVWFDFGAKATYDASAMTLTFKKQVIVPAGELTDEDIILYTKRLEVADGTIQGDPEVNQIVFKYYPNGAEYNDGSIRYVGGWLPESPYDEFEVNVASNIGTNSGFNQGWKYGMVFPALGDMFEDAPAFTFEADKWTKIEDSDFNDGWLAPAMSESGTLPPYKVTTYVNKENPKLILLENPYGPNSPFAQVNTYDGNGYIMLDITVDNCVLARPNITAGFTCPELGMESTITCLNKEGNAYYIDGEEIDDIIEEAEAYDDDLPTITEDYFITLPQVVFSYVPMLGQYTYWITSKDDDTQIPMITEIQLNGYGVGVNGVMTDVENSEVRYFNLQGMEVVPAAGQIVIVKQGNKASKVVF